MELIIHRASLGSRLGHSMTEKTGPDPDPGPGPSKSSVCDSLLC